MSLGSLSNKSKIVLLFILSSFFLIFAFIIIDMSFFSKNLEKSFKQDITKKVFQKENDLNNIFQNSENTLFSIRKSKIFMDYIKNQDKNISSTQALFLTIVKNDLNIMQLRYIDSNGLEKIRIDRDKINKNAFIKNDESLQNKSSRYYFYDSKDKEYEKVWFSNIDLNIENGKVEIPFNPTLRAILPIKDNNNFNGILIINYFMEGLLSNLFDEELYNMILLDKKGNSLLHYKKENNWSFYTNTIFDLKDDFPLFSEAILVNKYLKNNDFISKELKIPTLEKLILVLQINEKYIKLEKKEKHKQYIIESILVFILFIIISYLFSELLNKLTHRLEDSEKYNKILNEEVDSRTKQLKKSYDYLSKLNENLEKAEEMSNLGHWRLELKGKKLNVSNNLKSILGYGIDENISLSKFIKTNIHRHDKKRVLDKFIKLSSKKRAFKIEFRIIRKRDGEIRYIECNLEYKKNKENKIVSLIGTIQDVTEFSLLQNELSILRQAIEQAPISIIITNEKGKIEYVNPNFSKVTSYTNYEVIGKNPRILKSEYTSKEEYKNLWDLISNGKTWSGKFKNIDKNGKEFWELAFISPIYSQKEKKIKKYIAIKEEITQEVYLRQELKDKEELMILQSRHAAMGEMVSMIAHQWRQPITVINMSANNMLASIELDLIDNEELREIGEDITKQTEYLSQTIEDFRNFFKPNKEKSLVKISTIFSDVLGIMGKSLDNNNISFNEKYKNDIEFMTNDKELLQVFINIIKNSEEVLKEKDVKNKKINILEYLQDDSLVIEISDNGGGIKENIIEKIFDPYFSTKDESVGTGLGLYMSKTIVEKHLNGTIKAYNKIDGACFRITINIKNNNN